MSRDLTGKEVIVFAANYIYTGNLVEVTHDLVWLDKPAIIYETGDFKAPKWKDAQDLPCPRIRIERSAIESMGEVVKKG